VLSAQAEGDGGDDAHRRFLDQARIGARLAHPDIAAVHEAGRQRGCAVIASDEGSGSIVEAAIDDFRIVTYGCSQQPCPADLDGDDTIGQGDLGILLSDFGCADGVGNCPGDVDNDGDTDQGDLGILLAAFGTPCP